MSHTFSIICIKLSNCFPSPCTRLSLARTTTEAPFPCQIFRVLCPQPYGILIQGIPICFHNNCLARQTVGCDLRSYSTYCGCSEASSCSIVISVYMGCFSPTCIKYLSSGLVRVQQNYRSTNQASSLCLSFPLAMQSQLGIQLTNDFTDMLLSPLDFSSS